MSSRRVLPTGGSGKRPLRVQPVKDPTAAGALAKVVQKYKDPTFSLGMEGAQEIMYVNQAHHANKPCALKSDEEFPALGMLPSTADLDRSLLFAPDSGIRFEMGQWVERLGNDMIWHLEPIRRTVRVPGANPEIAEYDYYFKTTEGLMVRVDKVRCPEEALKRHFGLRPWVWQQWANLRIENYVRFQKDHERDWTQVSFVDLATDLWQYWLDEPRNREFKALHDSKPESAQEKLYDHFMHPFALMDEIKDEWDFEAAECSTYQYTAFLGSGFITSLTVVFIQLTVPFLLLAYAVRNSTRFPNFINLNLDSFDYSGIFSTDWSQFCYQYASFDELVMNVVVFFIYTVRQLPMVMITFYETIGDMDTVSSKLNSIRLISWKQGDDTPWMQVGYKLNLYMNTAYIALINCTILIILFLTDSTVDIILNALAIEFVAGVDEEVASYVWYDDNYRYIGCAVLEIIICGELRLELCRDHALFCSEYDIDPELYDKKVGGPLSDVAQSRLDSNNADYLLTAQDKLFAACAVPARESGRALAIAQYLEARTGFGVVDKLLLASGVRMPSILKVGGPLCFRVGLTHRRRVAAVRGLVHVVALGPGAVVGAYSS